MQTGKKEKKMLLVERLIGTEKKREIRLADKSKWEFHLKKNKVFKCHAVVKSSLHLCWKNS